MTIDEIKIRQLTNQYLLSPGEKLTVVRNLLGIQAQFMSNAVHALKIRCSDFEEDTAGHGLVKNWTIRGTVHIFSQDDLPLFMHCNDGQNYRNNQWNDKNFWNQRKNWALTPERQAELSRVILSSLAEKSLTREELKAICLQHGMSAEEGSSMFDPWGGGIRLLCERGFIHYAVQEKKTFCLSPEFLPMPEDMAELEMAKRYFTHYGPATQYDAMYFFQATGTKVKKWLDMLPIKNLVCDRREYFYIENDRCYDGEMPSCLFLAGFDPLMLGYEKKESLYLSPENMRKIFNLAGIIMPAVLVHGKIIGKWKKVKKKVAVDVFRHLSANEKYMITQKAEKLWPDISQIEFSE